jgi:hypothetical protein
MQISQEILDYTFDLLAIHQPATIAGEYDGSLGEITMTFVGDTNTYSWEFDYDGSSYEQFREIVIQTAGYLVSLHNTAMGIPSREPFIESVTEPD